MGKTIVLPHARHHLSRPHHLPRSSSSTSLERHRRTGQEQLGWLLLGAERAVEPPLLSPREAGVMVVVMAVVVGVAAVAVVVVMVAVEVEVTRPRKPSKVKDHLSLL